LPVVLSSATASPWRAALMLEPPGSETADTEISAWAKPSSASMSSAIKPAKAVLTGSSIDLSRSGAVKAISGYEDPTNPWNGRRKGAMDAATALRP